MRDLQEGPDREWDAKLGILTAGAGEDSPDMVNFRYEPTPYAVLERLAGSGLIGPDSVLIDYGCGRGRCTLFLHAKTGCRAQPRSGRRGESQPGAYDGSRDRAGKRKRFIA